MDAVVTKSRGWENDPAEPVYLIEQISASFTQVWLCPPPPVGVTYEVTRQEWVDDWRIRIIREIAAHPIRAYEAE